MKQVLIIAALALAVFSAPADSAQLRAKGKIYEVSLVIDNNHGDHPEYFGIYASPYDYTGGTRLSLFPNGEFVISAWADIGPHDFLIAYGTYTVRDASLVLKPTEIPDGRESSLTAFSGLRLISGSVEKNHVVYDHSYFLLTQAEWKKLEQGKKDVNFMYVVEPYFDWENTLRRLKQSAPIPKPAG